MKTAIVYIHGQYGSADEANYYKKFFNDSVVYGFDYKAENPWDAKAEFRNEFIRLSETFDRIILIAVSIGAFFSLSSGIENYISKAFFISPVTDMEKLITDMIILAGTNEKELEEKGVIQTSFGNDLSWEYLSYVRRNRVSWDVPTHILYGSNDNLQSSDTVNHFAHTTSSSLTVMENGEHWFHTEEQMKFLDNWMKTIIKNEKDI